MKHPIHLFFTLFIFSFANSLLGQGWERIIPEMSYAYSAVQTPDNGFIIVGASSEEDKGLMILKINAEGKKEWENSYPDSVYLRGDVIIELSDGNYAISGPASALSPYSLWITKIDVYGRIIWTRNYYDLGLYNLIETSDGGFLLGGATYVVGAESHPTIQKIKPNGDLDWQKVYNDGFGNNGLAKLSHTADAGFILTGRSFSYTADSVSASYLIKTDSLGNKEWVTVPFADSTITCCGGTDVIIQDDGYVITGQGAGTIFLWKTDLEGNSVWYREHKGAGGLSLVETHDGGYAFTGLIQSGPPPNPGFFLTLADSNGLEIKTLYYGVKHNLPFSFGNDIINTINNGFFIIGHRAGANHSYFIKTDSLGLTFTNAIKGKVAIDDPLNCEIDSTESPLINWMIKAEGEGYDFFGNTDSLGNYLIETDTGNYTLNIFPTTPYWQPCEDFIPVYFPNFFDTVQVDFSMEAIVDCPFLEVDITTPFLRRCFNNTYYVNYCNSGTIPTDTPYIQITLDTFLNFINSSIPLTSQNGNILTFDLDTIGIGECGNFTIEVEVDCDAPLGQTHCVEAHIYPDSLCLPTPTWAGGSVEVDATCVDDTIHFSIKNDGNAILSPGLDFIVIEDDVILYQQQPIGELAIGEVHEFSLEAGVATYRLEADQEPNHPGNSMPTVIVEGCSNGFTPGFVNQFPMDDADPFLDIDCRENIGSYDPNDKLAFPEGYAEEHFIEQNTDIEYLIRFQNTGTDTAFRVVIRDTLSPFLDVASVRLGAASHDYEMDILGQGVLKFTFNNILLPDSTTNEAASHGFIKFKISQKENLPLGSVINNSAAIYFDFNAPIITNTTWHTIGEDFIKIFVSVDDKLNNNIAVNVFPNPFSEKAIIELNGINNFNKKSLLLFNSTGQLMQEFIFENNRFEINGAKLNNGVYYFKIKNKAGEIANGKMVILK